uniref:Mediator of RNA polymerase II transcription subunit 7 n=1 Tax=Mucochytrium quahogii TaxID=96639 RepID=A0A7S2RWS2_9STRA|mmetsp:Transcript_6728/g.10638  ORF Transcript_6728/g.10638 Transcript_6728/m.10638 type:complete len:206 (+) Transcript_6728:80-697(+)
MDDEDESVAATLKFPAPPVYYKSYGKDGELHPLAVSLEPPQPPKDLYNCFGDKWELDEKLKTLKEEGREELFERKDGKLDSVCELARLSDVLIAKYTSFLANLPDMDSGNVPKEKVEDIETLYINLVYLVNQLRPSQGRQLLINMLRSQLEDRVETTKRLHELVKGGKESIEAAKSSSENTSMEEDNDNTAPEQEAVEEQCVFEL